MAYSTFMGTACISLGIAVDSDGNAYITGYTSVEDFPVTDGVYQATLAGGVDAFITKINAAGSDLVYSTYLGGSDTDSGNSIAVDSNGNAYVAGSTDSYSFPTFNPYQGLAGNKDIFITKLNSDGSALVYSTYLGGVNNDSVSDMALDSSGNVYITGTTSADFPSVNPFWTGSMSASDVFVSKLGTSGSNLVYSTRFGGSEGESGEGIAVDINGCAYVVGRTNSSNFPIESPLPNTAFDFLDVFVTKISPTGDSMIYSTYIGGANDEFGEAIAVDVNGNAFIAGHTQSADFPTVSPFQESLVGGTNVFIAKIFDDALPSPPDITVTDSTDPSDDLMVSFGEVTVETPSFKTVKITNDGGEDLILGQIGLIDSLATPFGLNHDCDQTTLTQGQSCDFQVFFQTDTAGLFSDSFDIVSNDPDEASVTINLEGTGIAFPDISVDLQVPFGSVTVGTLLSQTVTINNDGHANLVLGQIAMDNPLADPFSILNDSCSDLTVSPGASCTFDLSFLPSISGIFEDSFDIPSDDPDETVVTVAVNGMGTAMPSTDAIPPQVVFVTPNGPTNISINLDHLTATFSEAMDAATIDQSSFTLESTAGSVSGTVTYDPVAKTAHFLPGQDLVYDRTYTATILTTVQDVAGNALALDYTWNFTTRLEPTGDCSPEIGQEDGCVDFDGFTYGTGVRMSIGGHNILYGPTDKDTGRSEVSYEDPYDDDSFLNDDFESAAKARVDGTAFSLGVRAQDKTGLSLGDENSAPEAHAASRIDVTGIPPGSLLPMTIVIDGSLTGGGSDGSAGVTLRVYDFEFRTLGTVSAGKGTTGTWLSFIKWTNPYDQNSYVELPDLTSVPGEIRLDFLYPVMPGNGIFVWMNAWAYKHGDSSTSTRSEYFSTARLEVNPRPGVQVRLASGQTFTGGVDSDGDGVADNEDSAPNDSSIATPSAATGSGLIEVGIDASSNSGMSLSQVQTFDTSDLSINQEGKPAPSTRTFPHGLVSFRVNGVQPGGDTTVILTFPEAIPDGAKYYKVDANGFYEFPGAVISGNTVTLTLTDDGTRNGGDSNGFSHDGVIDDPGGIAVQVETPDTPAGTGGGGGGGCFISTMKE